MRVLGYSNRRTEPLLAGQLQRGLAQLPTGWHNKTGGGRKRRRGAPGSSSWCRLAAGPARNDRAASQPSDDTRTGLGNSMSFDPEARQHHLKNPGLGYRLAKWSRAAMGRMLYNYYNWREGTVNDLQLFLGCNLGLFVLAAGIEGLLLRHPGTAGDLPAADAQHPQWWLDLYEVCRTVFGQDMPGPDSALVHQVFAVAIVAVGLASFALVLALVEQVLLEVLTANVAVGSRVYEEGHTVLLCWVESTGEAEQVMRLLKQLCLAYRESGGRTIVVLTQRGKLEMEALFRAAIPPSQRFGSTLVFRCGSPLDPEALRVVSCATAASIIISGDYSRTPLESDTQVVRATVLLDELLLARRRQQQGAQRSFAAAVGTPRGSIWEVITGRGRDGRGAVMVGGNGATSSTGSSSQTDSRSGSGASTYPTVVVQVKGPEASDTLHYTCGRRVHVLPTKQLNACRLARLVRQPVAASLLRMFSDFGSDAHLMLRPLPCHLAGHSVHDIMMHLPNATLLGLQRGSGCDEDAAVSNDVIDSSRTRGSGSGTGGRCIACQPATAGAGSCATLLAPPADTVAQPGDWLVLLSSNRLQVLPQPLLLDSSSALQGAQWQRWQQRLQAAHHDHQHHRCDGPCDDSISVPKPVISMGSDSSAAGAAGSIAGSGSFSSLHSADMSVGMGGSSALGSTDLSAGGSRASGPRDYQLPHQFYGVTSTPQHLLICGWSIRETMAELLTALDHGPEALPRGSTVTLVSQHCMECSAELAEAVRAACIRHIKLRHVYADPRSRASLAAAVDVTQYSAAVILSDNAWRDATGPSTAAALSGASMAGPDGTRALAAAAAGGSSSTPTGGGSTPAGGGRSPAPVLQENNLSSSSQGSAGQLNSIPDALRMDAAVLAVQLNIRMLLEARGHPDINIVCEKQNHVGRTRFEDTDRLPLGITFNVARFSAKLLAQAAVDPRFMTVYQQLGAAVDVEVWDASELAAAGEELSYCELQARALHARQAVLLGHYYIPQSSHGIQLSVNPQGAPIRTAPRVWNTGEGRCKLLLLARTAAGQRGQEAACAAAAAAAASITSDAGSIEAG